MKFGILGEAKIAREHVVPAILALAESGSKSDFSISRIVTKAINEIQQAAGLSI